jgi:ABC-type sulfate/molybdate transport systems ATPase subunit
MVENAAVILVSHYPHHIKKMCDQVLLLDHGKVRERGNADRMLALYQEGFTDKREPLILLDSNVISVTITNVSEKIDYGDCLEFSITFNLRDDIRCGQSYINIVDNNDIVNAQCVINGLVTRLKKGAEKRKVIIGPLHLATGRYSCNLVLYGQGGKTTIVHMRHFIKFEFCGAVNLGPVYYPPSSVAFVE